MTAKLIALIYLYLVSAASLALIVVGIFSTVNFILNVTQYEQYPLRYYETDCETNFRYSKAMPAPVSIGTGVYEATPSAQELDQMKKQCQDNIERERKRLKIDDIKNAITFTTVGLVLFGIHFRLARKQSD